MNKFLISCLVFISLAGCQNTGKVKYVPDVVEVPQEIPVIYPANPIPLKLENVQWQVWNRQRIEEELKKNNDKVWFVLSEEDGKKLAQNLVDILDYTTQIKYQNDYFRDFLQTYNERAKLRLEEAKKKLEEYQK